MASGELPEVLQALIAQHTPSMDHIAVLLVLRAASHTQHPVDDVVRETRLDRAVVAPVLEAMARTGMLERDGDLYRYAPSAATAGAVDELAHMYHTRPVTLVRAIYDRPKRAVQSFADAFRLRKEGT